MFTIIIILGLGQPPSTAPPPVSLVARTHAWQTTDLAGEVHTDIDPIALEHTVLLRNAELARRPPVVTRVYLGPAPPMDWRSLGCGP